MQLNKGLLRNLLGYFMRGLLLVVPFVLTAYLISLALHFIDGLIKIRKVCLRSYRKLDYQIATD
ncbi:MAG: hypothetical protein MUC61_00330 [Amoebophilaceae bacterium]|nr:hypothetical protein [Amoebophilaceae bacterium]